MLIEEITLTKMDCMYICSFLTPNFTKNRQNSLFTQTFFQNRLFLMQMKDYCLCVTDLHGADWQQIAELKHKSLPHVYERQVSYIKIV